MKFKITKQKLDTDFYVIFIDDKGSFYSSDILIKDKIVFLSYVNLKNPIYKGFVGCKKYGFEDEFKEMFKESNNMAKCVIILDSLKECHFENLGDVIIKK